MSNPKYREVQIDRHGIILGGRSCIGARDVVKVLRNIQFPRGWKNGLERVSFRKWAGSEGTTITVETF